MKHSLIIACLFFMATKLNGQNSFPLISSGGYTGGSGDFTNITNAQLKLQSTAGYIRVAHLSAVPSISAVYNYEANKNVFWGEDSDGGQYLFRGRDVNIGRSLWVDKGATISSDFADNDPNYSWNYNLMVRNNNNSINTFSRLSFVSQSAGYGAISLLKTGDYTGDMYFQVRNGAGFFNTPLLIKSNGNVGIGTSSPDGFQVNVPLANENAQTTSNVRIGILGSTPRIILDKAGSVPFEIDNAGGQLRIFNPGAVRLVVNSNGYVGIGTASPDEALTVKGKIHTNEVKVDLLGAVAPDYVFEPTYDLKPLAEIETYIKENKHLPEVPSAKEMEKNGVQLGEMNMLLLKKVEELTLYSIEQNKKLSEQQELIQGLIKEMQQLKTDTKKTKN